MVGNMRYSLRMKKIFDFSRLDFCWLSMILLQFFSIANVDINKIIMVFFITYRYLFVHGFQLKYNFDTHKFVIFKMTAEITWPPLSQKNSKMFFSPSYISYLCYASEKSMIKLLNFLQHRFQTKWNFLKKASALWPSTERVN
jgi:hypothetical protein